jgi:hypothetical protein
MTDLTHEPDPATSERLLLDLLTDRCEVDGTRTALRHLFGYAGVYEALETALWPHVMERWREEQDHDANEEEANDADETLP